MDTRVVHRRHEQPLVIDVVEGNLLGQFLAERDEVHQLDTAIAEGAELPQQHGLRFLSRRQDQAFDVIQVDKSFQRVEGSEDGVVVEELANALAVGAAINQTQDAKIGVGVLADQLDGLAGFAGCADDEATLRHEPVAAGGHVQHAHGDDGHKHERCEPEKNAAADFDRECRVKEPRDEHDAHGNGHHGCGEGPRQALQALGFVEAANVKGEDEHEPGDRTGGLASLEILKAAGPTQA